MSKTEEKWVAAERLMSAMQSELTRINEDQGADAYSVAVKQFRRIEKFLGFEPNSWGAGA